MLTLDLQYSLKKPAVPLNRSGSVDEHWGRSIRVQRKCSKYIMLAGLLSNIETSITFKHIRMGEESRLQSAGKKVGRLHAPGIALKAARKPQ